MVDMIEVTVTDLKKKHKGKAEYENMYSVAEHVYMDDGIVDTIGFAIDKDNLCAGCVSHHEHYCTGRVTFITVVNYGSNTFFEKVIGKLYALREIAARAVEANHIRACRFSI